MVDADLIADALFERFRRFMVSALAQPIDVRELVGAISPAVGPSLAEWIDVYEGLLQQRNYDPQTLRNYGANLRHVRRLWGEMALRDIRPRHISTGLQEFLPNRAAMARRIHDTLRDVFREAVADERCENNPVLNTRRVVVKVKRKRLSLETWDKMCEAALTHRQAWVLPMLVLGVATGQRRADLAKMRFDDVWDEHLHVEQQKKAGKEHGARIALPMALRLNVVGMTLDEVVEVCRHYAIPGNNLLRRNDGKPIELSSLSTRFNQLIRSVCGAQAYGPSEWPSLHEMRSLSERLYRAQGIHTQHLLGHASQEMTDKYNNTRGLDAVEWKRVPLEAGV